MVMNSIEHKKKKTFSKENPTTSDSFRSPEQFQPTRDQIFMDRDTFILHKDLQEILKELKKITKDKI